MGRKMRSLAAAFLLLASASAAQADVVTLCQSDDQAGSGTNLIQALRSGGQITFACGGPATIAITQPLQLPRSGIVTIDGGGQITLDGGGHQRMFIADHSRAAI